MKVRKNDLVMPGNFTEMNNLEICLTGGDPGAMNAYIEENFGSAFLKEFNEVQPIVPIMTEEGAAAAGAEAAAAAGMKSASGGQGAMCAVMVLQTVTSIVQDAKKMM